MVNRRGFLQLVGLGAVGSIASVPLFGIGDVLGSEIAIPTNSLTGGHLVVSGGYARGIAKLADGIGLYSSPSERVPGPPLNESGTVVKRASFGAGRVSLHADRRGSRPCGSSHTFERPLEKGEDGALVFYVECHRIRDNIRDQGLRVLADLADSLPQGTAQLVTVCHRPIGGNWNDREVWIDAQLEHWVVYGDIEPEKVFSTTGEYPIAENLDIEHLLWADQEFRHEIPIGMSLSDFRGAGRL